MVQKKVLWFSYIVSTNVQVWWRDGKKEGKKRGKPMNFSDIKPIQAILLFLFSPINHRFALLNSDISMVTGSNLSHGALMTDWVAGSILIDDWRNSQKQAHIQLGDLTGSGPPEPNATPVPLGVDYISRPANSIFKEREGSFVRAFTTHFTRANKFLMNRTTRDWSNDSKGIHSPTQDWWFYFGNLVIINLFSL